MPEYKIPTNTLGEIELNRLSFNMDISFGYDGEAHDNFVVYNLKVYYITDFEDDLMELMATAKITSINFINWDPLELLDISGELYEFCDLIDEKSEEIKRNLFDDNYHDNRLSLYVLERFQLEEKYRCNSYGKSILYAIIRSLGLTNTSSLLCLNPIPLQYVGEHSKSREDDAFISDTMKIIQVYEEYGFEIIKEHRNCDVRNAIIMGICLDQYGL